MLAQALNLICGALMLIYGHVRVQKQSCNTNNNWQGNKCWNQVTCSHSTKLQYERDAV